MAIDTSIRIRLIDGFSAGIRGLQSGVTGLSRSMAGLTRASEVAGNFNQAAEGAGRFAAMTRGLVEQPVMAFAGFETAMSRVAALTHEVGTDAFSRMQAQAEELGAATSFSATEAATAMGNFAQAGMNANQVMALTPPTMALARAAAAGLDQTSGILGNTLNTLHLDASQAGMAADVLAATFSTSNTTLASLGAAFEVVAPLARDTGTSIQTLASMVAVLGNSGIQASEAGTGLRTVMSALEDPAGAGAKALRDLGLRGQELVRVQQMVANGRMPDALAEIGARLSGLTNDRRIAALMQIFGREGVTSASILIDAALDTGDRGLAGYEASLRSADGAAQRMATTMEDNLGGEMERARGAVDGAAIAIGRQFAPRVRELATFVQGAADRIQSYSAEHPLLTSRVGDSLIAVTGFSLAVRGIALAASTTATTLGLVSGGFGAVGRAAAWVTTALSTRLVPALASTRLGAALAAGPLGTAAVGIRGMGVAAATALGPFGLAAAAIGALALAATQIKSPEGQSLADAWGEIMGSSRSVVEQLGDGINELLGPGPTVRSAEEIRAGVQRRWEEEDARRRAGGGTPPGEPAPGTPGFVATGLPPAPPPSLRRPARPGGETTPSLPTAAPTPAPERAGRAGQRGGVVEFGPSTLAALTGPLTRLNTQLETLIRAVRSNASGGHTPLGGSA